MTILLMNVLVDTKLITKETLILKTLLIIVCVYILETIYFKDILCCWNIMCVIIIYNTLFLVVLSIYFQFSLYHIIQIYKFVINTHINMKKTCFYHSEPIHKSSVWLWCLHTWLNIKLFQTFHTCNHRPNKNR